MTCATTLPALISPIARFLPMRADARLADTVTSRIDQLKACVAAADLPHVDIRTLRRASEELVVALQAASAKLGLPRPTLEAQSR